MDINRTYIYRLLDRARSDSRWMKKVITFSVIAVLSFVVITVLVAYLAINSLMNMASAIPDKDLIVLRELLSNKVLVLTEDQKSGMMPLVNKISEGKLSEADKAAMKQQIYGLLEPAQRNRVDASLAEVARKTDKIDSVPQQLMVAVKRYTGISIKSIRGWTDALLTWWKAKKPENSAGKLADELNSAQ